MRLQSQIILVVLCALLFSCKKEKEKSTTMRTMVFTETAGYRHESIEAGKQMFRTKQAEWDIEVSDVDDSKAFTIDNLADYKLIVLLNCSGALFAESERAALQNFVRNGGKILGIHAAADAEYDWAWYPQMLGGWFHSHPDTLQEASCTVVATGHLSAAGLPNPWRRTDEWYNIKSLQSTNQVVLTVDEGTYTGGIHGAIHPVSWCREFENGRIFYTSMGHTVETYSEPDFIKHIGGAIRWLRGN